MNEESNRLNSFASWSSSAILDPTNLARLGFYRDNLDIVCSHCNCRLSNFQSEDEILRYHTSLHPDCVVSPQNTEPPILTTTNRRNMDLNNEQNRLLTFRNWPIDEIVSKHDLARAGFYYLNRSDQVKCIYCFGVIGQWEQGDNPVTEHRKFFSNCPKAQQNDLTDSDIDNIGIQTVRAPKAINFSTLESRLRSFTSNNWRQSEIQSPEVLSEAGFYYQGVEDEVRCFYCDGGLRFWLVSDDPFFEHARWFPKCPYVQLIKGQQYIADVLSQAEARQNAANASGATTSVQSSITCTPASSQNPAAQPQEASQQVAIMSIDDAMVSEPVNLALQMGLNAGRVRMVTQRQLNLHGRPFTSAEALVEAVLDEQIQGEGHESTDRNIENEVTRLLLSAVLNNDQPCTSSQNESASVSNPPTEPPKANPELNSSTASSDVEIPSLSLEEENRRLKSARECKICMSNEVGVVFLPCGHLLSCLLCASSLQICPLCRSVIKGRVRTFLS